MEEEMDDETMVWCLRADSALSFDPRRKSLMNQAARRIEQLARNLRGRDDFIVGQQLWDQFCKSRPDSPSS